jgi:hypothetical protein
VPPTTPVRPAPSPKLADAPARRRATPTAKKRVEPERTPTPLRAGDVPPLPPDAFEILSILPGDP